MRRDFCVPYWARAVLCCTFFAALTFAVRNSRLDDALIYARYVKNALSGHGLVYNVGEPVNALTSVLDTWLQLGLSYVLGGHVILAQMLLGISFFLVIVLAAEAVAPCAGLFLSVTPLLYDCIGMETSLFLVCLLATIWAYEAGKINWLPTLCLLCILARFEGGALVIFVAWQLWRQRRFPSPVSFLIPAGLIAFYLGFNFYYFHHLLPQSATAKFGQGRSGYWGKWPTAFLRIPTGLTFPWGTPTSFFPVLAVFAGFGAVRTPSRAKNEIVLPFLVALAVFYIGFNIPSYFWYYAPFVFFLTIFAVRLLPNTRVVFACVLFILLLEGRASYKQLKEGDRDVSRIAYEAAGAWIRNNTPANARIATAETGSLGWTCDRYLIDTVGLTTPENGVYTAHADYSSWLKEKPDYVVLHPDAPLPWDTVVLRSPDYELLPVRFGEGGVVGIMKRKE